MKNKINQALFTYWNRLRGARPAPSRGEIEPRDITRILPYLFILERKSRTAYNFRLAGTGLCSIYGMEFRNHNMLALWQSECQNDMEHLLNDVTGSAGVGLVEYTAEAPDRREIALEMILLPVMQDNGAMTRILGAAVPLEQKPWLGEQMLIRQSIDRIQLHDANKLAMQSPAEDIAWRITREQPPVFRTPIANIGRRRPVMSSERSYLRLVKSTGLDREDAGK